MNIEALDPDLTHVSCPKDTNVMLCGVVSLDPNEPESDGDITCRPCFVLDQIDDYCPLKDKCDCI